MQSQETCRCCSVVQSCPTLCDPMGCSTPGFLILHHLPERAQTHVHWVGDAIQSSHPLSSSLLLPQSFPAPGSFPVSQLFTSGGQSTGASTSASVLPMNIQDRFPLGLTGLTSLQFKRLYSPTSQFKSINYLVFSFLFGPSLTYTHDYWKNHTFDCMDFFSKVMSLLFNTLSRFVIVFLPRCKHLLISWL